MADQKQQLGGMAAMTAAAEAHSASLLSPSNAAHISFPSSSPSTMRASSFEQETGKSKAKGLKHRQCQAPGCSTQCNFGFSGSHAVFCSAHKLDGQINVNHRICQAQYCQRLANFSYPGEKAKFCGAHKLEGMQSRHKRPTCAGRSDLSCHRQPVFGYPGQSRRACSAHRSPGMEGKTVVRRCRGSGCNKSAGFNYPDAGAKADFCEEHRVQGMVSLRGRECEAEGCFKRASFRLDTGTVAIYCTAHREPGMVNIKRKACEEAGCSRPALTGCGDRERRRCRYHHAAVVQGSSVNIAGAAFPLFGAHAQDAHQAPAGPSPLPRGRSCRQSSPQASVATVPSSPAAALAAALGVGGFMMGTGTSTVPAAAATASAGVVPMVDARCEHPGCWRDAVFAGHADPGRLPRFCHVHRMDALVDFSIVRCDEADCDANASWGYYCEGQATKCGTHRLPQMVDVKARRCLRGGCSRVPYFTHASFRRDGAAFCSLHKTEGMLDVKSQKCSVGGCENLPLDNCKGEVPSSTCREHGAAWSATVETGFPSPITDADTAEAATVVASLWADAIGGDWSIGEGTGNGGASGSGCGGSGTTDAASADRGYTGGIRGRRE